MDGKAYCVVHKQGLFTIDINGQMDEQVEIESLFLSSNSLPSHFDVDHIHSDFFSLSSFKDALR